MNQLGIFVDVQNIYYTTKAEFNRQFNYRSLWKALSERGEIATAIAYATARNTPDEGQLKFQSALRHIGFEVKLKPYIQRVDGSAKGDWDVGITIDVLEAAPKLDQVVLLSGDGDFDLLVDKIKQVHSVRVSVVSVAKLTANSLVRAADEHWPIDTTLLI